MKKTILHVDINSYFATLLQQENPFLRNKPVGVIKDAGRTCIIAASKEAKKLGVQTGSTVADARQFAPHIVLAPADFELYLDATKRLKRVFESIAPDISIFSLDEAFLDITDYPTLSADPYLLGEILQKKIKKELGDWVTCNVGISHNHFLSKLASETGPKGSISSIDESNLDLVLAEATFADVCGVGFRLQKKLAMLNVYHPYQIRFFRVKEDLEPLFGPFWSKELMKIAYGEEPHFLTIMGRNTHMKSVGRSITGFRLARSEAVVKRVIYNLLEEVTYKVRKMDLAGRYAYVRLYGEEKTWGAHKTLKHYVRHTKELFDIVYYGLCANRLERFPVIRFAVGLGYLKPIYEVPISLLPSWQRQEQLYSAFDIIAKKYGLFTVYGGLLHNSEKIRPEVTGFLGDKLYQLN